MVWCVGFKPTTPVNKAEEVGFEPTRQLRQTVFKTATITQNLLIYSSFLKHQYVNDLILKQN